MGPRRRKAVAAACAVAAAVLSSPSAVALDVTGAARGLPPQAVPEEAQAAAAAATAAAKEAWAAAGQVKAAAEENMKFVPLAQGQVDLAKAAAETAAEQDAMLTKYYEEVRGQADTAALQAANAFMARVQAAVAEEKSKAVTYKAYAGKSQQVETAKAAMNAARPYNAMLLRGQKVAYDYAKRAQELAAASNHLRVEGMNLAGSAEGYQQYGQPIQANQIMMTAHSLMSQSDKMKQEAMRLQASAEEIKASLPLWQQAEQAAAASASEQASEQGPPRFAPQPPDLY